MNRTASIALLAVLCNPAFAGGECPMQGAQYRLDFDAVWSAATHPADYPPLPHFSGLVGGVHSQAVSFWTPGQLATIGIERMAELGAKTALIAEVNAAIGTGDALAVVSGGGINPSPGSVSVTFEVSQTHRLATVVAMIAPSPDWFVGVAGLDLFHGGDWVGNAVVDLAPYDAGTDSGTTYLASNVPTSPAEPISVITGYPFINELIVAPLGSFTFTRLDTPCSDGDNDGVADDTDNCTLVANPGQTDTDSDGLGNACDPDVDQDCLVSFSDLNSLKLVFLTSTGDPAYDVNLDFDDSGTIDFDDLNTLKLQFLSPPGPSGLPTHCD